MAYNDFTNFVFTIDPPELTCEPHRELKLYWEAKKKGRLLPSRADIEPLELRSHMGYLFLIDVLPAEHDYRFRLLGSAMTGRYGRDSTGRTIREAYATEPAIGQWILDIFDTVVRHRVPVVSEGRLTIVKKSYVIARALQLPLADDGETVNMILGEMRFFAKEGTMEP
jgi:hypothetical protein